MDTLSINSELNIFNAVLSLAKINDVVIFLCFPILVTVSHRVGRFKLALRDKSPREFNEI